MLVQDLRHSANWLWGCVFCCHTSVICYLHAKPRPTHQTIATCFPGAPTSAISPFFGRCPRSFSCLMWRFPQCSNTFRFLAGCPRDEPEVFWSCHGNPSFAFPCLPAHRNHQSLLACFSHAPPTLSTSPSVCFSSFQTANGVQPQLKEKLGNVHVKKKSLRGACSMPGAQTTTPSDHEESTNQAPWRDQTPWCSPSCSILARSVLLQFLLHLRSLRATTNQQSIKATTHRSMGCRAHALWPTQRRLSIVLYVPVCLTPNRRLQNR